MAGVPGFEPGLSVLETDVLTVDTIPLRSSPISQPAMHLLGLFMTCVFAATATELAEFQAVGRGLLILGRHVIPALAILTLKHNIIAWHAKPLNRSIGNRSYMPYIGPISFTI